MSNATELKRNDSGSLETRFDNDGKINVLEISSVLKACCSSSGVYTVFLGC